MPFIHLAPPFQYKTTIYPRVFSSQFPSPQILRGRIQEPLIRRSHPINMTGKAKPKKHTAKELAAKIDAATTNRGGGKAGLADRSGIEKGGHAKYECPLCKVTAPDVKSMQIHHDAKHPKVPFDETKINNLHATIAAESSNKPKPGVRGSLKK